MSGGSESPQGTGRLSGNENIRASKKSVYNDVGRERQSCLREPEVFTEAGEAKRRATRGNQGNEHGLLRYQRRIPQRNAEKNDDCRVSGFGEVGSDQWPDLKISSRLK